MDGAKTYAEEDGVVLGGEGLEESFIDGGVGVELDAESRDHVDFVEGSGEG